MSGFHCILIKFLRPRGLDPFVSINYYRFELLRPHYRSPTASSRSPIVIHHYARISYQPLTPRAYTSYRRIRVPDFLEKDVGCLMNHLAPEMGRFADLNNIIIYAYVNRLLRRSFNDQEIIAGVLELWAEFSSSSGLAEDPGERGLEAELNTPGAGSESSGQGPGRGYELVLGAERVYPFIEFIP